MAGFKMGKELKSFYEKVVQFAWKHHLTSAVGSFADCRPTGSVLGDATAGRLKVGFAPETTSALADPSGPFYSTLAGS
jgi:hypothetical protein